METNFNFKSQVCTSIVQSRRLLELGLKKETADMCYSFDSVITQPFMPSDIFKCIVYTDTENKNTIPAWSLGRLIETIQEVCPQVILIRHRVDIRSNVKRIAYSFDACDNLYDNIIDCIEWLIYNKKYLEE